MEEFRLRSARSCPLLLPWLGNGAGGAVSQPYCLGPAGQVRSPSPRDLQRFCAEGRYYECPGYRFWRSGAPSVRLK